MISINKSLRSSNKMSFYKYVKQLKKVLKRKLNYKKERDYGKKKLSEKKKKKKGDNKSWQKGSGDRIKRLMSLLRRLRLSIKLCP